MSKNSKPNYKVVKRTIKLFSTSPDLKIVRAILRKLPDAVICAICNASLNARQGEVVLLPSWKQLFWRYHRHFDRLADPRYLIEPKRAICIQIKGLLPIIPALLGTVLCSLGSVVISRIIKKRMSNYFKNVLIEKGELDRLQQRQIREFLPEVHNMAYIRSRMALILDNKNIPADTKLSLLNTIHTQFEKLHKDISLPSTYSFTTGTSEPAVTKVKNDTAVNKTSAPTDNEDTTDQEESGESDDERQSEKQEIMSDDKSTPLSVEKFGFHQQYQSKASSLLFKITEHPDILKRNDAGEMVVFGKAEPDTNFNNLFKSMVDSLATSINLALTSSSRFYDV